MGEFTEYYTLEMPYRYLKKIMGREPDDKGDNSMTYYECEVNACWYFSNYQIINYDYQFYVDLDKYTELPVRKVGIEANFKENIDDIEICEFMGDNDIGDVDFYKTHVIFKNDLTINKINEIINYLIKEYTSIFNDTPTITYRENKMINTVNGEYIKLKYNRNSIC